MIARRIKKELSHFVALPETAKLLTLSYFLRSIAYPLMSIFTGAFIWQTSNDIVLLILYHLGNFIILPVMFVANAKLLRIISLRRLYAAGVMFSGLGPLLVIFQRSETPLMYLLYGILYGIGNGLYWANRNYLTVRQTTTTTRSYFTGLQFTLAIIASMVIPPIAGWIVIALSFGYQLLAILAVVFLLGAGFSLKHGMFKTPVFSGIKKHPSSVWNKARWLSVAIGCVDSAIYILPTVLILKLTGNEAILGLVSGIASGLSGCASYVVGRKYRQPMFSLMFPIAIAGFILSGVPMLWGISIVSVSWYLLIANLSDSVIWIVNEPVIMDMIDDEVKRSGTSYQRLIAEREGFLNIGRIAVTLPFLAIAMINQTLALETIAVLCGAISLIIAISSRSTT